MATADVNSASAIVCAPMPPPPEPPADRPHRPHGPGGGGRPRGKPGKGVGQVTGKSLGKDDYVDICWGTNDGRGMGKGKDKGQDKGSGDKGVSFKGEGKGKGKAKGSGDTGFGYKGDVWCDGKGKWLSEGSKGKGKDKGKDKGSGDTGFGYKGDGWWWCEGKGEWLSEGSKGKLFSDKGSNNKGFGYTSFVESYKGKDNKGFGYSDTGKGKWHDDAYASYVWEPAFGAYVYVPSWQWEDSKGSYKGQGTDKGFGHSYAINQGLGKADKGVGQKGAKADKGSSKGGKGFGKEHKGRGKTKTPRATSHLVSLGFGQPTVPDLTGTSHDPALIELPSWSDDVPVSAGPTTSLISVPSWSDDADEQPTVLALEDRQAVGHAPNDLDVEYPAFEHVFAQPAFEHADDPNLAGIAFEPTALEHEHDVYDNDCDRDDGSWGEAELVPRQFGAIQTPDPFEQDLVPTEGGDEGDECAPMAEAVPVPVTPPRHIDEVN